MGSDPAGSGILRSGLFLHQIAFLISIFQLGVAWHDWIWLKRGHRSENLDARRDSGHAKGCIDAIYFRPTEVETLRGDASKARDVPGWAPNDTLDELASKMSLEDLKSAERDELMRRYGFPTLSHRE